MFSVSLHAAGSFGGGIALFSIRLGRPGPHDRRPAALVLALLLTGMAATPATLRANEKDRAYLRSQLDMILEYERTAKVVPWENSETGNRGAVRIDRTYFFDPTTPCRDYVWTLEDEGRLLSFRGTGCRETDGRWKLTEAAAPAEVEHSDPEVVALLPGAEAGERVPAVIPDIATANPLVDFSDSDRAFLRRLLENVLEFERTGEKIAWDNPETDGAGTVMVLRTFFYDPSVPCRDYEVVQNGTASGADIRATETACRWDRRDWGLRGDAAPTDTGAGASGVWDGSAPSCGAEDLEATVLAAADGEMAVEAAVDQPTFEKLDLVFAVDMSGSMGSETSDLRSQLWRTVKVLSHMTKDLNVGVVAFKDRGEDYLTREFELAPMTDAKMDQLQTFVMALEARGGGDQAEPVDAALKAAIAMPWRNDALGRIFVVGDAAVHKGRVAAALESARTFHAEAPLGPKQRQVSSVFTGRNLAGSRFYGRLAHEGGGSYVGSQARLMECVLLSVVPPRRS